MNHTESKLKWLYKIQCRYFIPKFSINRAKFWACASVPKQMAEQKLACGEYFETCLKI